MQDVIKKVKHGLWQLSMGTTGFEEATEFSKYVVNKSKELISLLESGDKAEDGWISVKDKKNRPKMFVDVLIHTSDGFTYISCVDASGKFDTYPVGDKAKITHWQPLPKPPQG